MQVLRDLRSFTKLLILVDLKTQPRLKLRDIAKKLEITVQGVSEYIKIMMHENLIVKINGEHRLTQTGVEFLHKNMSELKSFVDSSIKELNIINSCTAISRDDLKKDELVSLTMKNGMLVAKKTKSSKSKGIVLYNAKKGEDVVIINLTGIVDYNYGKITIVELPKSFDGGSRAVLKKKLKDVLNLNKPDRIAISDPVGYVTVKNMGLTPDIEFSPLAASLEAAQRGLNVMLTISTEALANTISFFEDFNSKTKEEIRYSIVPMKEIIKEK